MDAPEVMFVPYGDLEARRGQGVPVLPEVVPVAHKVFLDKIKNRGRRVVLDSTNVSRGIVVDVDAPLELPEHLGIDVSVRLTGDSPSERVRLEVEWGNGDQMSAIVDAVLGTSFSIFARRVRVVAVLENGAGPIDVVGSIAVGASPTGRPPTRTIAIDSTVLPTVSVAQRIPDWARTMKIFRTPASVPIKIDTAGSNTIETYVPGYAETPELVIPNGTTRFRIRNDDAVTNITQIRAVFGLALG